MKDCKEGGFEGCNEGGGDEGGCDEGGGEDLII